MLGTILIPGNFIGLVLDYTDINAQQKNILGEDIGNLVLVFF
jgi:hypothetical protein